MVKFREQLITVLFCPSLEFRTVGWFGPTGELPLIQPKPDINEMPRNHRDWIDPLQSAVLHHVMLNFGASETRFDTSRRRIGSE